MNIYHVGMIKYNVGDEFINKNYSNYASNFLIISIEGNINDPYGPVFIGKVIEKDGCSRTFSMYRTTLDGWFIKTEKDK